MQDLIQLNKMKKQFCTYEISLKLKELGFDEECLGAYMGHRLVIVGDNLIQANVTAYEANNYIKAPLWQQVIDWCAEKYNINIYVAYCEYGIKTENSWKYSFTNPTTPQYWVGKYKTKKEAREQAVLRCIELLKNK